MMKPRVWALAAAILNGVVWPAVAAEIIVPPGDGTLAAAIASATSGDTLVLQDGTYTGTVTVDKSLTIRPVNRATYAVLTGGLAVQGDGISVTVQRLRFTSSVSLVSAAAVRVLENEFASGNINIIAPIGSASGLPAVMIVGNRFASGGIVETNPYVPTGIYVAGNTFTNGRISLASPSWIVGNDVAYGGGSVSYYCISVQGGSARILGNRISIFYQSSFVSGGIYSTSPYSVIQGNIIETARSVAYGITSNNGSGFLNVVNNLVNGLFSFGIRTYTSPSRLSGNILTNGITTPIYLAATSYDVSHNLCWNNGIDCPAGDGNLNADPQFVDLVDYRLAATSPAIDAGPPDYEFADLDRTRNDMGAYGGPYSIGQYDVQRDATNLAPFVYPLVNSAGGGILEAQALGVARLR